MTSRRFGALWIVAALVAGAGGAVVGLDWLLRLNLGDVAGRLLVEFGTVGLSTFVGAWAAFLLQEKRDKVKARAAQAAALRSAQFVLVAQVNVLESLNRDHLALFRDADGRHFMLQPMTYFQEIPAIDQSSLNFLLNSSDPDLPNVLLDCQNKWNTVIGLIRQRSQEHVRFQEVLEQVQRDGKVPKDEVSTELLTKAVGPRISAALRDLTSSLYQAFDRAVAANTESFDRLVAQLRTEFPGERILRRTFDPPIVTQAAAARAVGTT